MYEGYHKYVYEGPVFEFDRMLVDRWRGETTAPSEKKALSNLTYQYKMKNNRVAGAKVTLPGKIKMVG